MRFHDITKEDMLQGEGLRVALWLAGCEHMCKGCQNPCTWDIDGGLPFNECAYAEIREQLQKDYIHGLTLTGGDPLHKKNIPDVTALAKRVKLEFPDKTIWLYTGYVWDEIHDWSIMEYIDVLVDGRFELAQKDVNLQWKGSANQRVIDVQDTLKMGKVVLHA